ncbi:MAG: prepilin peptidase [Gammaproteobacteria bacterium]|nr:prepilin peptidase [Gammaproteobacteria bacterium]
MKDRMAQVDRTLSLAAGILFLGVALVLANDPHGLVLLQLLHWLAPGKAIDWMTAWAEVTGRPFTPQGLAVVLLIGYAAGGFLTTAISRIPARESAMARAMAWAELGYPQAAAAELEKPGIGTEDPHCIHCHAPIPIRLQTPVLAWLLLRGRAACCGQHIQVRYPLVEILTPALFTVIAWRFGPDPILLSMLTFCAALVVLAFIDLEHLVLPDVIVLPLLWCGLAVNVGGGIVPPGMAILGAATGYLFFRIFRWGYFRAAGQTGLGLGDCKLAAAIGAWCGPLALLHATVLAMGAMVLFGALSIASRRLTGAVPEVERPLGPWLAGGILFQLLFPGAVPGFYSLLP